LDEFEDLAGMMPAIAGRLRKGHMLPVCRKCWSVDSISLPVLNAYARLPLEKKLEAIRKLALVMADTVRFTRDGNGLSIVTNQCISGFTRVAKDLPPDEPLDPYAYQVLKIGGKQVWKYLGKSKVDLTGPSEPQTAETVGKIQRRS